MEFSNSGGSVYHKSVSVYAHSMNGQLLSETSLNSSAQVESDAQILQMSAARKDAGPISYRTGVKLIGSALCDLQPRFLAWFVDFVIRNTRLQSAALPIVAEVDDSSERITQIFEEKLLSIGRNDQWNASGRVQFKKKVQFLTQRRARVEFCLPAFPCKSTNKDKVFGTLPDKGEEIALRNLHDFVGSIERTYSPGAKVWIVSDGHVFSDCIGVDDNVVDSYNSHLMRINTIISGGKGQDKVGFLSLSDLFLPNGLQNDKNTLDRIKWPEIYHPVNTTVTEEAEMCRKILIAGCGIDPLALKKQIKEQDPSLLALYRGFSKFMLEDLSQAKEFQGISRARCKTIATKVAFEMIQRNQAYSNLVETLFPLHIRLSIHRHNNAGPKFGINLLPVNICRHGTLNGDINAEQSADLLHIPTPWHNCIFQVEGDKQFYVAKSKDVRNAIQSGFYDGSWSPGSGSLGGNFSLRRPTPILASPAPLLGELVKV